ncbi:MAG: VWA domain-containing protein [Thermoanaerobaculales bacterium]|nr:VWA domain-containing protein [Thermoanaerobaculales bacterium]
MSSFLNQHLVSDRIPVSSATGLQGVTMSTLGHIPSFTRTMAVTVLMTVVAFATPAICRAADAPEASAMLILDGSGSMWGQIEGVTKIEIAKQTLTTIIKDLPDSTRVGLILYGHRKKGDCDDVETAVAMGPIDKNALVARISAVNPKGKTPITRSIKRAVEEIRLEEAASTIVLVSDGEETCDPDPCEAARLLKESGVDFVIHVVGFDVTDEQSAQLKCIAEATGGRYYSAGSAEDFAFAAREATRVEEEPAASGEGRVWLDEPTVVAPGGRVTAHFEAAPTFHEHAWIGVVPSEVEHGSEEVNDRHDSSYEFIRGRIAGTSTLSAPSNPGTYDVRLHDSDRKGREVAHATFRVEAAQGRVWLDKTDFTTGEKIAVHFEANAKLGTGAWAGIVPSDIPHGDAGVNDKHDVDYRYIKNAADGTLELRAPATAGNWDVRLHDTDTSGREIASVTFTVTTPGARVWLDRQDYLAGQKMVVHFSATSVLEQGAWVGIVPSEVAHGSSAENDRHDVGYKYVSGKSEGTIELKTPGDAGSWDVRLHDSATSDGSEIASATFSVKVASGKLVLAKTRFAPGEELAVQFTMPEGLPSNAWIGIIPSEVAHGSSAENDRHDVGYAYVSGKSDGTVKLKAPGHTGRWDVRLHDSASSDGNEIASVTFVVE